MIPHEPDDMNCENCEDGEEFPGSEEGMAKALAEAQGKAAEYLDNWKRAQADFINYKRYTEQERLELGKYANTQLILKLLPILDDFERAVQSMNSKTAQGDWVEGIKLIERKFKATLEAQGITPIHAVGEEFDPNLHEALMHVKGEEGKVIQELQQGYKLYDKVIRPTKVAVGNGELAAKKEEKREKEKTQEDKDD